MSTDTKPNVGWRFWGVFAVVGLGWRLIYRDAPSVIMFSAILVVAGAFALWRWRRSRGGGAVSAQPPVELRAATEARWAQGAAEARQREADRAAEYERAAEQRRREAAARREAEAAGGRRV